MQRFNHSDGAIVKFIDSSQLAKFTVKAATDPFNVRQSEQEVLYFFLYHSSHHRGVAP